MSSTMSANIFINYRREDSAGHSGRLFDGLSCHFAGRLFMDVDTLEPGVDFVDAIKQAVGSCEVLIVVIGREWLSVKDATGQRRLDDAADFVRLEVETALERKIRVIPVLVQDAAMPRAEQLPPALALLARRNAIQLSDARWAYDVDRLARTVQKILREEIPESQAPVAPPVAPPVAAPVAPRAAPVVAPEAEPPPAPAVPAVAAKAARSTVLLRFVAALGLVAAASLACVALIPEPLHTPAPPRTATLPSVVPTPPAALAPAVSRHPTPPASPAPTGRGVVIPVELAGEGRGHREKEEQMKVGDLIFNGPGVEQMQLLSQPPPDYPPSLAGTGRHATIVLQVLVDEKGSVSDSRVESVSMDVGGAETDLRELRKAAQAAARQARFEPATKNGIAGKMWGELTYEFGPKK